MIHSKSTPLLVADGQTQLANDEVIVGNAPEAQSVVAMLVLWPGDTYEVCYPIRLVARPSLPSVVIVPPSLAAQAGLSDDTDVPWEIQVGLVPRITARAVTLMAMGGDVGETAATLARTSDLDGRLFHVRGGSGEELALTLGGQPYRVTSIEPRPEGPAVLEIKAGETQLTLVSPNNGTGVDIVVLADCSGSMGIADLPAPETGEAVSSDSISLARLLGRFTATSTARKNITRIQAVRDALKQFVERRRRTRESVSRIALVGFGSRADLVFPESGMEEIDANMLDTRFQRLTDKIATLASKRDGTNIALALQFAASHLSNFGRPGNRRLIVLLSDGADWTPRGEDATGEMLSSATEDPVSLMAHLHEAMNIQLQAIGISNSELYGNYCTRNRESREPSLEPNHRLLHELLTVAGGEAARIGDASVLEGYFRGLGTGVAEEVRINASKRIPPRISEADIERAGKRIHRAHAMPDGGLVRGAMEYEEKTQKFRERYHHCAEKAQCVAGGLRLWSLDFVSLQRQLDILSRGANSSESFRALILSMYQLVDERLPDPIRKWKRGVELATPLAQAIAACVHGSDFYRNLTTLRNRLVHATGEDGASVSRTYAELGDTMEYFAGVRHLADNDAKGWSNLGLSILDRATSTLQELDAVLERFNALPEAEHGDKTSGGRTEDHVVVEW